MRRGQRIFERDLRAVANRAVAGKIDCQCAVCCVGRRGRLHIRRDGAEGRRIKRHRRRPFQRHPIFHVIGKDHIRRAIRLLPIHAVPTGIDKGISGGQLRFAFAGVRAFDSRSQPKFRRGTIYFSRDGSRRLLIALANILARDVDRIRPCRAACAANAGRGGWI